MLAHLTLRDFRSYAALDLPCAAPLVALAGENGAGKTNILEALSLLAPGRGLRRAELQEMAREGGAGGFTIAARLDDGAQLGFALTAPDADGRRARATRINGANASSHAALSEHLRVVWLTPEQDGLFRGAAGDRRRFLDRLVLAIDPDHGARVAALEKALRDRNRLLEDSPHEALWLDAVERQAAELGVAVAAARRETVERLSGLIQDTRDTASPFPWAELALDGDIDRLIADQPALAAEEASRRILRDGRARDRAAGRALFGPQASDLMVRHGPKGIAVDQGSTGEQKALLVGLVLAHARLVGVMSGLKPLVLMDEIAAHFDPRRRLALYEALAGLGSQVWMSGADMALFDDLPASALRIRVGEGAARAAA
jgi:DNA replication and repair protein RecF